MIVYKLGLTLWRMDDEFVDLILFWRKEWMHVLSFLFFKKKKKIKLHQEQEKEHEMMCVAYLIDVCIGVHHYMSF